MSLKICITLSSVWFNGHSFYFGVRYPCVFLLLISSCTGYWIEHLSWQISLVFFEVLESWQWHVSDWLGFGLFWCSDEVYVWNVFYIPQKWRNTCLQTLLALFDKLILTCLMQQCLQKVFVEMSPDPSQPILHITFVSWHYHYSVLPWCIVIR